jgi:hypothetical protein
VIVRPDAANVTSSPVAAVPAIRTVTVVPRASAICEATVLCQINSYSRKSSPSTSRAICPGVRNVSPDGRIASCASCAFLTLRVYCRGVGGT